MAVQVHEERGEVVRETYTIEDTAKMLGISRWTAYKLARNDEFPVPVIRLGSRMVVSKRAIEELLSIKDDGAA